MSDLISRKAAIEALEWKWAGKAAMDAIKALPPAQPEHGRWLHGREVSRDYIGDLCVQINYDENWWCSKCNYHVDDRPVWKFCPNCGSRNEVDENDCY